MVKWGRSRVRGWGILKGVLLTIGTVALVAVFMAFTPAPFYMWYGMGMKKAGINRPPDYIVVMGGGGMPSESGLMRCWYGAKVAGRFTRAMVIVALPGDIHDSISSVNQMKQELVLRGVAPERILLEDSGTNTRAEALCVQNIIPISKSLLIVTSPEHLLRAVLTFKKAGFMKVDGLPAFEKTIESDLSFSGKKLGGHGGMLDIGKNITVRYQFWMQMNYELLALREWTAMGYYKLMGWI